MLPLLAVLAVVTTQDSLRIQIDFGYVQATGNSNLRTLNAGEQLMYRTAPWRFTQTIAVVNGRSGDSLTANNLKASGRAEYEISTRVRGFGLVGYERDPLAGLARRLEETAGLSFILVARARHAADAEAGAGFSQQRGTTSSSFAIARLAARHRYSFSTNAYLEEQAELVSNLEAPVDRRINGSLSLVAPLSVRVAMKLGYTIKFDNQPEPGFKKTDTVFAAGIQVVL